MSKFIGDYIMPYGKYKGERISDIPSNYLKWFLDNHAEEDKIYMEMDEEYQLREKTNTHWDDRI